jgi:hypothetical protein
VATEQASDPESEDAAPDDSDRTETEEKSDDKASETEESDEKNQDEDNSDEADSGTEDESKDDADDETADESKDDTDDETADESADNAEESDEVSEDELDETNQTMEDADEAAVASVSSDADFTINNGTLTKYTGTATEIVIPDTVVTIGAKVFKDNTTITSVTFLSSVTTIGASAFEGCTGLYKVELNEGLINIGASAFSKVAFGRKEDNGSVTYGTLTIPSTVQSIGTGAFYNCKYLGKVVFEEDETKNTDLTISSSSGSGGAAFGNCGSLKSVELPNRLTEIQNYAFNNDTALETVSFGSKLAKIGFKSFDGCTSLKSITLPDTVQTIGENAFNGCTSLAEVTLNEGLIDIGASAFSEAAFGRKEVNGSVTYGTLTIPGTVQSIGKAAFYNCEYLSKVVFEDNPETNTVLTISSSNFSYAAFGECGSLKSVVLPDRLTEIQNSTFYNDTSLEKVTFGSKLETIGVQAFWKCESLKSIELPATVKTVGDRAFSGCKSLAEVTLNEGIVTIGEEAFSQAAFGRKEDNGSVTYGTLTIPGTVQSIGKGAFYKCPYLKEVVFENGSTVVLTISSSVYGSATFGYCDNLQRVILPERLEEIQQYTFVYNPKLTAVYIPKSVTKIADNAFDNSKKVTIYGVKDSYAEDFANTNNLPFKTKDALGLNVTGISLSPKSITRAGEEALGKTIQLTATVKPSTAQNKKVTYSSSKEAVATVDDNGLVTLTGYGEAVITAKAADKESTAETQCKITVLKTWTEAEKQAARKAIEANNDFVVLTNTCDSLQDDVEIQTDGSFTATWRLPYTVQPGANSDYDIVLHKKDYQDTTLSGITVKGVRVDGLTVDGTKVLSEKQSGKLRAEISMTGNDACTSAELGKILTYNIDWTSAKPANLNVSGSKDTEANIQGGKAGNGITVTAKLVLKKGNENVADTAANKGEQWFTADTKVNVLAAGIDIVTGIEITAKDAEQNDVALSKLAELTEAAVKTSAVYTLTAAAKAGDKTVEDCALTWKSSDTKVADVKVQTDTTALLTIKGQGSSTITVTAAKNGGYTESFRVTVKDSTPRLQTDSVTLNLNLTKPEALITLLPSDGFAIDDTSLKLVTTAGETSLFSIVKKEGTANQYSIGVNDASKEIKTGKYKLKLQAKTAAGEAAPHELALTVQVVKQSPKVTITQGDVLNLYEKDGVGKLQITTDTDAKISSITFQPGDTSGAYLAQKAVDVQNGSLTYQLNGGTKDNYKQAKVQGTLTIKFADYGEAAKYEKKISLKVNKNLPKFSAAAMTLYPDTAADTAQVQITDQTAKEQLATNTGYTVTADTKSLGNYTVTSMEGSTPMSVKALKGAKNATVKLKIYKDSWITGITAATSLKVKIAKAPALSFSTKTVILNTSCVVDGQCSSVEVTPYIEGFADKELSSVSFTGSDAKSEQARTDGMLSLTYKDGVILASIEDETVTAGKYTYNVKAVTTDEQPMQVSGKLTVSVVTKQKADISLKTSGSIDLLNRSGSGITYKITTKNYTDTIDRVDLIGQNADRFALESNDDGSVTLRANAGKSLKIKTAYPVTLQVTYKSGVKLSKTVKVTPKQMAPKFTADVKSVTLFESVAGEAYAKDITFTGSKLYTDISKIELVDGQGAFDYTYGEDGSGSLYVKADASAKTGKTYTLKFAVTLKDAAANGAPVYVTMKVNYRK